MFGTQHAEREEAEFFHIKFCIVILFESQSLTEKDPCLLSLLTHATSGAPLNFFPPLDIGTPMIYISPPVKREKIASKNVTMAPGISSFSNPVVSHEFLLVPLFERISLPSPRGSDLSLGIRRKLKGLTS